MSNKNPLALPGWVTVTLVTVVLLVVMWGWGGGGGGGGGKKEEKALIVRLADYQKEPLTMAPASRPSEGGIMVMGLPMPETEAERPFMDAVIFIHFKESRLGQDEGWKVVGPDGELGEMRVTPIWCRDIKRLFGEEVDPFNVPRLYRQVLRWLMYYGPLVGAEGVDELYELYRRGPSGFREWRGSQKESENECENE